MDPFASAENTPATETTEKDTPTVTTTTTGQGQIVTTIKHGAGFEVPWNVVYSPTAEAALETMRSPEFKELLELTAAISKAILPEKAQAPASNGRPAGSSQAPDGQTPPEGYVFKSGMSKKTGKPWKAFMPIDRNSGLEAIWL